MPNVLLISGEGRNVGKTTLGCRLVNDLCYKNKVIVIKVSPHFHPLTGSLEIIKESSFFVIALETDKTSGKDSSRYLNAGAALVYYVQYKDQGLKLLSEWIQDQFSDEIPVICESGGLSEFITPGHSIHIRKGSGQNEYSEEIEIIYNNLQPESIESNITWKNNTWQQ